MDPLVVTCSFSIGSHDDGFGPGGGPLSRLALQTSHSVDASELGLITTQMEMEH
jgi:hypothetical protein